ncbi:PAP2 superfamily protein [Haloarcula vallismortis]|uniref:Glucose-6-phosphatase n=2 Tax=Haloarcula vallismortis TaxID=28442 RepID=M0JK41_HALVA|nr:phosphatase PAP2 family protein [Haloarcula vallismortis]EMA09386.1 glucose-6-phosphatase [Haloarcula vallismortis ATCC 29715]SDW81443.1 PAP2 superfamily protein [Haloarcula vallismortis]
MIRAVGVTEVLSALPGAVVVLFALITQLGDFWFTFLACGLLYWLGPWTPKLGRGLTRDRTAMLVALLAVGVALVVSLKGLFMLPRPPGAGAATHAELLPAALRGVYESMATGEGFGFPSGHATLSLLVWGGIAWALRVGTRRQRTAAAGTIIALIGLSRLVLGVHYLADILAGFVIAGTAFALALGALKTPERVFGLAAVIAVLGLLVTGVSRDSAGALGVAVAGAAVWSLLGETIPEPTRRGVGITALLGVVSVGTFLGVTFGLDPSPVAVTLLAGLGTGALLTLPLAGEGLVKKY